MKIEIFTPAGDYSGRGEGGSDDPVEEWFDRKISWLEAAGIKVQVYRLDSDPVAFAEHAGIADLLEAEGKDVLPVTFIDGKSVAKRHYLTSKELERAAALRGVRVAAGWPAYPAKFRFGDIEPADPAFESSTQRATPQVKQVPCEPRGVDKGKIRK